MNKLPEELYGKELKILTLPIKKEWFDKIKSGEKLEEYREIKDYWAVRMCHDYFFYDGVDLIVNSFTTFNYVLFINGYGADKPRIWVECKGISIGTGRVEWGAVEGVKYLVTKLGRVLK